MLQSPLNDSPIGGIATIKDADVQDNAAIKASKIDFGNLQLSNFPALNNAINDILVRLKAAGIP